MFCSKCGADNPEGTRYCRACGEPLQGTEPPAGRPDAVEIPLAAAILTAIFCCQPFGIVAIVFAAMAQGRLSDGNTEAARDLAEKSWYWIKLSLLLGIVWFVVAALFFAVRST